MYNGLKTVCGVVVQSKRYVFKLNENLKYNFKVLKLSLKSLKCL